MQNLLSGKTFAVAVASSSRAAGTSDLNGASFDCQKYRSLATIIEWDAIAATAETSAYLQGSDDDTTWKNLAGTKVDVAADDDNKITVIGLEQPVHRYNRVVVDRGTANAALHTALYMAGWTRDTDVVHNSAVQDVVWFVSPAEGTP